MHPLAPRTGLCALLAFLLASASVAQQVHDVVLRPRPAPIDIEPGRTVTNGWLYDGLLPGPELRVTEGDTLRVTVINELPEWTTVHWHGLPVPMRSDGVPGVSQGPIGVGQRYTYEFVADRPGTYWYHPHRDLQIDRGLVGALIVEPRNPAADPPFDVEHVVMLDDWLPGAPVAGRDPVYSDHLINGRTSNGQTPLTVQTGQIVRLRFLNVSGFTNYVVTVDGHPMRVTHTDGQPVVPVTTQAIPIGVGERYDVYLDANNPGKWSIAAAALTNRSRTLVRGVLAYQGSTAPTPPASYVPSSLSGAPLLSYGQLAGAGAAGPLSAQPDRTYSLDLGWQGMHSYVWTIGGQAFPNAAPVDVSLGQTVRFRTRNFTMHAHPMHLHGHFFKVVGSGGGTTAPLVKDTVLVPRGMMMGSGGLDVEFVADNPGNWPYHCHMIYHMAAGMMRLVRYVGTDGDADGLPDGADFDPAGDHPVTWTEDRGGRFLRGSTVLGIAQWLPGEGCFWFVGPLLGTPQAVMGIGLAAIRPDVYAGWSQVLSTNQAELPVVIPVQPDLRGLTFGLQVVATHPTLSHGLRISTVTPITVR